jgi:hypothetical protein
MLQGFFPPPWNEARAHGDQLARTFCRWPNDINRGRRRDVVVRLQGTGGAVREFLQVLNVAPGVALDEAPAHWCGRHHPGRLMADRPPTPRPAPAALLVRKARAPLFPTPLSLLASSPVDGRFPLVARPRTNIWRPRDRAL